MPPMDSNDKNEPTEDLVAIIQATMGTGPTKQSRRSKSNNRRPQKTKPQPTGELSISKRTDANPEIHLNANQHPDRSSYGQNPGQANRGKGKRNRNKGKSTKRSGQKQDQGAQDQNHPVSNEPQDHANDNPGFKPMPNSLGVVPANNPPHKMSQIERLIRFRYPSLKDFVHYDEQGRILPPGDELENTRWGYDSELYRVIKWYSSASAETIEKEVREEIEIQRRRRSEYYTCREAHITPEYRKALHEISQRPPILNRQKMNDMKRRAEDPNCCPEREVPKIPNFDVPPTRVLRPQVQRVKNRKPDPQPQPTPRNWVEAAAGWGWENQPTQMPVGQKQTVESLNGIAHDVQADRDDKPVVEKSEKSKFGAKGHQQKQSQDAKSKKLSNSKQPAKILQEKLSQDLTPQTAITTKPQPVQHQAVAAAECDREYYIRTTPSNFVIGPSPANPQASHVVGPDALKLRRALQAELPMIHAFEDEDEMSAMVHISPIGVCKAAKDGSSSPIYMEPTEQSSLFLKKFPAEIRNQIYENVYDVPILCLSIPEGPLKRWAIPEAHPPKQGGVLSIKKNGQAVLQRDPNRPVVRYPGILGSQNPEYNKPTNRRRQKTYHNGLVNTCKQIWHEASSALYHQTTFFFQSTKTLRGFLKSTHPEHLFHVHGLHLDRVTPGVPDQAFFNTHKDKNHANFDQACADAVRLMPNLTHLVINIYVSETPVLFELDQEWLQPFLRFSKLCLRESRPLEKVKVNIWSRWCKDRTSQRPWWKNRMVQLHRAFADAVERMILTGDPDYAMAEYHKQTGTEFWRNRDHLQHFNYMPWEKYEPKDKEDQDVQAGTAQAV